jgi:predicted NBD/HSP70 family sugar kinase
VELSKRTGIFRSSVSAIVDELVRDGLLIEERAEPQGRGRVPINLYLNPQGFRVLGVSIRPFQTRIAAAGLRGTLHSTVSFATPTQPGAWLKQAGKAIKQIRGSVGGDFRQVGISVPSRVNGCTGEILMFPALPKFGGFPIAAEVSALAGAKAAAENDCNAGALAELWLQEAEVAGVRDFVYLQVADLGVGSGLMLNGEMYAGHDHTWVGEFGHMIVDRGGPPCHCGRRGCWQLYVCDRATWQRYDAKTEFTTARFEGLIQLAQSGDRRRGRISRHCRVSVPGHLERHLRSQPAAHHYRGRDHEGVGIDSAHHRKCVFHGPGADACLPGPIWTGRAFVGGGRGAGVTRDLRLAETGLEINKEPEVRSRKSE